MSHGSAMSAQPESCSLTQAPPIVRRGSMVHPARDRVPERAILISPVLPSGVGREDALSRDTAVRVSETAGLAKAIGLSIAGSAVVKLHRLHARAFLGAGKVEELRAQIVGNEISLAIMDSALSPVQQRNLERAWQVKVLDRTGLI